MRDLANNISNKRVISPVVVTNDTPLVGSVVDGLGFESVTYLIATGTLADVDATFAVLLEHSDQAATGFVAVPDSGLIGTEAAAGFAFLDDDATRKLGYIGDKRYTRMTITPTGNTGNAPIAAVAVCGHPHLAPVA